VDHGSYGADHRLHEAKHQLREALQDAKQGDGGQSAQVDCGSQGSSEASAGQETETVESGSGASDAEASAQRDNLWDCLHPDTQRADKAAALFADAFAAPMRRVSSEIEQGIANSELGTLPRCGANGLLNVSPAWVQQEAQNNGDLLLAAHCIGLTEALGMSRRAFHSPEGWLQRDALVSTAVARQHVAHMRLLNASAPRPSNYVGGAWAPVRPEHAHQHTGQAAGALYAVYFSIWLTG
jgi:hypothetical protein